MAQNIDVNQDPAQILKQLMAARQAMLGPYQKGVNKKLEELGAAHTEEAVQHNIDPRQIQSQAGLDHPVMDQQQAPMQPTQQAPQAPQAPTQQLAQPLQQTPLQFAQQQMQPQQQRSNTNPLQLLHNLVQGVVDIIPSSPEARNAYTNRMEAQQRNNRLNPEESINRIQDVNKKLTDAGLDYQGEETADGNIILKSKPSAQSDMMMGLKESQQQDRLEKDVIQRISSVRGDPSLTKVEAQRDASTTVYNTIQSIKDEGRLPSNVEYYDILGQLWKARTGQSPTDQAIQHIQSLTAEGKIGQAFQFATGKVGNITTKDILNNIQNFAKTSGKQADKLHEGYMKTRLIKPKGLDEDRYQNAIKNNRGLSFEEATGQDSQSNGMSDEAAYQEYLKMTGGQ